MSVINLNIQQPAEKSKFIFYSEREYERLYGWEKQRQTDKTHAVAYPKRTLFAEPQKSLSAKELKVLVDEYTNCDKLLLKYLIAIWGTCEQNNKPLQIKNETIATEIGCSVFTFQKAKKKFLSDKIFTYKQSNKYAVPVYVCLLDKKSRGILYNLLSKTTPHILKIKEPIKALKKSPFKNYREAVRAEKLGEKSYPHIHNLVDTDIIPNLYINNIIYPKTNTFKSNTYKNNILKGDIYPKTEEPVSTIATLCQQSPKREYIPALNSPDKSTFFIDKNIVEKKDTSKKLVYNNKDKIMGKRTSKMDLRTYQIEILKRLNPEYVKNLKKEFDAKPENKPKSIELNDSDLRIKLIEQAKKMHHKPSLIECDSNLGVFREKNNEYINLVRDTIKQLYAENGIHEQTTETIHS